MDTNDDAQTEWPTISGALAMSEDTAYICRDGLAVPLRDIEGEYHAETFWAEGKAYSVAYRSWFPRPNGVVTENEAFFYDMGEFFGMLRVCASVTGFRFADEVGADREAVFSKISAYINDITANKLAHGSSVFASREAAIIAAAVRHVEEAPVRHVEEKDDA